MDPMLGSHAWIPCLLKRYPVAVSHSFDVKSGFDEPVHGLLGSWPQLRTRWVRCALSALVLGHFHSSALTPWPCRLAPTLCCDSCGHGALHTRRDCFHCIELHGLVRDLSVSSTCVRALPRSRRMGWRWDGTVTRCDSIRLGDSGCRTIGMALRCCDRVGEGR